jgi:hypothetical protein
MRCARLRPAATHRRALTQRTAPGGGGGGCGWHAGAAGRADCNARHGTRALRCFCVPRLTRRPLQVSSDAAAQHASLEPAFTAITAGLARDFAYVDGVGVRVPRCACAAQLRPRSLPARAGRAGECAAGGAEDGGGAGSRRVGGVQVRFSSACVHVCPRLTRRACLQATTSRRGARRLLKLLLAASVARKGGCAARKRASRRADAKQLYAICTRRQRQHRSRQLPASAQKRSASAAREHRPHARCACSSCSKATYRS